NLKSSMHDNQDHSLSDVVIAFETTICENLKAFLSNLNPFMDPELTFLRKDFKERFVTNCVFESIVVQYINFILKSAIEYEQSYTMSHIPSQLILILSKICLDLSNNIIAYLFNFTEEVFGKHSLDRSLVSSLSKKAREYSPRLLNIYVWIEGQSI